MSEEVQSIKSSKKSKSKELAETPPAAPPEIDPVLMEKVQTLRQLVNISNMLTQGIFSGRDANNLAAAQAFVNNAHAPLYKEASSHPDFKRATETTNQ